MSLGNFLKIRVPFLDGSIHLLLVELDFFNI